MPEGTRHQLDSSVVAELFTRENPRNRSLKPKVRAYLLGHVGRSVRGVLSVPALGELLQTIFESEARLEGQTTAFLELAEFIRRAEIEFSSPDRRAYETALEILENDYRITPADALAVVESIKAKAVFVTLDRTLLSSHYLRERRDVKVIGLP
jgi:predicted nucleic acid-binding protein